MAFNPDTQVDFAADVRKTIMGDYSTLGMLDAAFDVGAAASFITSNLVNLNAFSGSKNMDDKQTKSLAKLLAYEYRDMKFSVLLLFFYRFKVGDFGKFYGKVDPMVITCALRDFVAECEAKRQQYLDEEYRLRREKEDRERSEAYERWTHFHDDLCRHGKDEETRQLFSRLNCESYNEHEKLLTFCVSREDYERIEDYSRVRLLSEVLKSHYPNARVQYRILAEKKSVDVAGTPKAVGKNFSKPDDISAVLVSARALLSNELGFSDSVLEDMKYAFKKRYGLLPEKYISRFGAKSGKDGSSPAKEHVSELNPF